MKVKINNIYYRIIETNNKNDKELWDRKGNELRLYGMCDNINGVIKIWEDLPYDRKRRTLTHELTHAFLNAYWDSFNIKGKYDQEDMCSFVEAFGEDILKIVNEYFLEKEHRFLINKVEALEKEYVKKRSD